MISSYILLLLCVTLWGSNFVIGKILVEYFSPVFLTAARLFFILIVLGLYTLLTRQLRKVTGKDMIWLVVLGIFGIWINHWTFYEGLVTADPTTSALILALTPIVTSCLAAIFLKERLTSRSLIGTITASVGVVFVIYNGKELHFSIGILWIFATMLSFSISIILVRWIGQRMPSTVMTLYSTIIGFSVLLPQLAVYPHEIKVSTNLSIWLLLALSAIFMHGICTLIWNRQLQKVGAAQAAIFTTMEPFITMAFSFVILGRVVSLSQVIGSVFIVIGVLLTTIFVSKR